MASASGTPTHIGSYSILALLGVGGMGKVYLARDPQGKQVALKVLLPELTAATLDRLRFEREFDIASRLSHPALVQVFDRHFHDDLCYYSMEYVPGSDMSRRFELAPGQHSSVQASNLALQSFIGLADCLHYLHERNIVHRDLKSENVLLDTRDEVRLLDFGLACFRRFASKAHRITAPGTVLGTPYSMAPEQILGDGADERSDLYSLGVMIYQIFCQKLPFEAPDPMAVLYQILHQPAPEFQPRLVSPPGLAELVADLLQKEPHQRPRDAAEVKFRLERLTLGLHQPPSQPILRPVVLEPKPVQRLLTPRFVGRRAQQSWFDDRLQQLSQGRGGWCLLEGGGGTGKSYLLGQWAAQAKSQGLSAVRVNPVSGSHIPYQLWTPVLRWALPPGPLPQTVLPFVPALHLLLPEISSPAGETAAAPLDDPLQRYHLYEGMARLIMHRSSQGPSLLLLDQIQDADPASLEFLHYFLETRYYSSQSPQLPLLAAAASVEENQEHPALAALSRLSEQQTTGKTLRLGGFDLEETRQFLESLLDHQAIESESVRYLFQETEGKPAYLLELARLGLESGAWQWSQGEWRFRRATSTGGGSTGIQAGVQVRLPARLQAALKQRLEGLDEMALEVLRMAAVLGPLLAFRHLQELCGLPDRPLYEICSQLEKRRLLVERSDFELASQGTSEVVLESMSWSLRRGYHARAAAYLEQVAEPVYWEVAQHWALAGESKRAGEAFLQAAQDSLRSLAFEEADRCLEEIHQLPSALRPLPADELDELWADALLGSARPHEAAQRLAPIVAQASLSLDRIRRLRKLGMAQEMGGELAQAYEANRRALELLASGRWSGQDAETAVDEGNRLCERQSRVLFTLRPPGWLEEFTRLVKAQLKLAFSRHSKKNHQETWAQALIYGGFWSMRQLKWAGGARLSLKSAVGRLDSLPESITKAHLLGDTGYLLLLSGSTRRAKRVAQEARDILLRRGVIAGLCKSYLQLHAICFHQGRIGESMEHCTLALQHARRIGNRFEEALALSDAAKTQAALGDLARAEDYLAQLGPVRAGFQTSYLDLIAELAQAYYFWAIADWNELVDNAGAMFARCKAAGELPHHTLHFGLLTLDGHLSRHSGEARLAQNTATLLDELNRASRGQRLFRPIFKRLQARAHMIQGRRSEAFEILGECTRRAELADIPWERYRCHLLLAHWLREEGLEEHHRNQAARAWEDCIARGDAG